MREFQQVKPLTEKDFIQIDYHYLDEVKTSFHGNFIANLQRGATAFWRLEQTVRLIPGDYGVDDDTWKLICDDKEAFDEYEITYVHNWRCTYDEIKALYVEIGNRFIDPHTLLISATTIIRPVSLTVARQYNGAKPATPPNIPSTINFFWNPEYIKNWEFIDRPLTSSLPHPTL